MTFDRRLLCERIVDSMAAKQRFLDHCVDDVAALIELAAGCLRSGGKIMLCGNGGSACDAAHLGAVVALEGRGHDAREESHRLLVAVVEIIGVAKADAVVEASGETHRAAPAQRTTTMW